MPKRSYPFDSLAPPQLKTHVGQKELIQGVCGESLKREIFERTKKLLFSGAKAVMGSQSKNRNPEGESPVHDLLTGQTTIGQDGKLHRSSRTYPSFIFGVQMSLFFKQRSLWRDPERAPPVYDQWARKKRASSVSATSAETAASRAAAALLPLVPTVQY
ncbi:apoptosis regulatory protein Siva isoform X3 [Rhinoderma darwinii]|uniref:apoptosis regulatory protein Siva isoform X3 n=1 Tax=Rhinoderma darwinii TaxID=43563 RepID=UPI003F67E857